MPNWEDEIISQLDATAIEYNFPMLDNAYLRNASIRLTAFRSPTEWLLAFQELAVSQQHGFVNVISTYGNKVIAPGTQQAITVIEALPGTAIWDEEGKLLLNPSNFTVVVRGQPRHFTPSAEDYLRAGIAPDANMPTEAQMLRWLAFQIPAELYLSDQELLEVCGRADDGLSRFLQLDGWLHPDLANDELPSQTECFRSLAHALSVGDPVLYECPEDLWNTHWSNWEAAY